MNDLTNAPRPSSRPATPTAEPRPASIRRFALGCAALAIALSAGGLLRAQDAPKAPAAPTAPAPKAEAGPRAQAEASIRRGLAWLVTQQHENGSFGVIPGAGEAVKGEAGMSALALRAMARAPKDLRAGVPGVEAAMEKCAAYLVSLQQADGGIVNPGAGLTTYRTSITIMALQSMDPKRFADAIAKGQAFLVNGQWSEVHGLDKDPAVAKKNAYYGGWGYDKTGTKADADMSNTHFVLEALKETGLSPDDPVWKRAVTFLQRCQNRSETNDLRPAGITVGNDGGFMYDPAEDTAKSEPVKLPDGTTMIPSYASITYAGLMSLVHANVSREDPRVKGAMAWIRANYTLEENRGLGTRAKPEQGKQGLYYYFHTFAKALAAWGEPEIADEAGAKHRWADELSTRLASLQKPEGFWVNEVPRWWENDPTLCTTYTLLALEIAHPFTAAAK